MLPKNRPYSGFFLCLEGPDGSGKSTQSKRVSQHFGTKYKVVDSYDPGSTEIGEGIRRILLDPIHQRMTHMTEFLLYTASRSQLVSEIIFPALERGDFVNQDRFFPSTHAYQMVAGELGEHITFEEFRRWQEIATQGILPHLTIIYDVSPDIAVKRLSPLLDRMEAKGRAFHEKVRRGYAEYASKFGGKTIMINTDHTDADETFELTKAAIEESIRENGLEDKLTRA